MAPSLRGEDGSSLGPRSMDLLAFASEPSPQGGGSAPRQRRGSRWVSLARACEILGVNESTVRRWADAGEIQMFRTPGGHRRFDEADLVGLVERGAQRPNREIESATVTRIRRELHSTQAEPQWYRDTNEDERDALRPLGRRMVQIVLNPPDTVRIAIVGKYVELKDAYKSITESFVHAGISNRCRVDLAWVDAETLEGRDVGDKRLAEAFAGCHGVLVPGGFGDRGIQGKINAVRWARERRIPYFGICLGMQVAMIEIGRDVVGLPMANSSEFDPACEHAVIDLMREQRDIDQMGGTMRLGAYPCRLTPGTLAARCYGAEEISERHRHRYEVNNEYRGRFADAGVIFSGLSPDGQLVEMIELPDHPFFLGCQFHPELKSRPNRAHPLFDHFVAAAMEHEERTGAAAEA